MRKDLYGEMFVQEKTYWWHVAKRRLVCEAIGKAKKSQKILDAGCGTGALITDLEKLGYQCWGGDASPEALKFCQKRGLKNFWLLNFEKKLPTKNNFFDKISCLDVLEHVAKDDNLLKEFSRTLETNGRLYITVPAYRFLWSYWDQMLGHKRRYSKGELVELLNNCGFRVCRASYFNSFLLLPVFVIRCFKSGIKDQKSDFVEVPKWLNFLLIVVSRIESFFVLKSLTPFGLSIFVEAQKK
jgi:SAM-dependent methyltransferase